MFWCVWRSLKPPNSSGNVQKHGHLLQFQVNGRWGKISGVHVIAGVVYLTPLYPHLWVILLSHPTGTILGLSLASERRHYYIRPFLIGQVHTQNDPWHQSHIHVQNLVNTGVVWYLTSLYLHSRMIISSHMTGTILDLGLANERGHYYVRSFLIGWAHIQNDPWQ